MSCGTSWSRVAKNTSFVNQKNGYYVYCASNVFDNMARGNNLGNYFYDLSLTGACNTSNNWEP